MMLFPMQRVERAKRFLTSSTTMLLLFYLTVSLSSIEAWVLHPAPCCGHRLRHISTARATTITAGTTTRIVALSAESNTDGSNSKKKRRRKAPPTESTPGKNSAKEGAGQRVEQMAIEMNDDDNDDNLERTSFSLSKDDLLTMTEIARFEFKGDKDSSMRTPLVPMPNDPTKGATGSKDTAAWSMDDPTFDNSIDSDKSSDVLPLPDIKEARKKKQMEEEMARMDQENEEQKVRIKRTDKEAFRRLLEQQPFADADESYFVEEEYGAVSALLGERAKPFLAIPLGPLQVGHFIGSLVFVLMAFVEYPGFPLTNLPTPLRDCFQGGLATVYLINTILAVIVSFQAPAKGQPVSLWAIKTFIVGGLAYDQFMQLPTLEEIDKAKNVKGSRAEKKTKR